MTVASLLCVCVCLHIILCGTRSRPAASAASLLHRCPFTLACNGPPSGVARPLSPLSSPRKPQSGQPSCSVIKTHTRTQSKRNTSKPKKSTRVRFGHQRTRETLPRSFSLKRCLPEARRRIRRPCTSRCDGYSSTCGDAFLRMLRLPALLLFSAPKLLPAHLALLPRSLSGLCPAFVCVCVGCCAQRARLHAHSLPHAHTLVCALEVVPNCQHREHSTLSLLLFVFLSVTQLVAARACWCVRTHPRQIEFTARTPTQTRTRFPFSSSESSTSVQHRFSYFLLDQSSLSYLTLCA